MTNLTQIAIADLDRNLRADIDAPEAEFTAWTAWMDGARVSNQSYDVIHHAEAQRGGIVMVGSGSSGVTFWTDAATPEEVLTRYLADDMTN